MEKLVADGRIHPQRIEELHRMAEQEVALRCQRAAEDAMVEVGITDLHPELVTVLGRLRYRTSYGQNVLRHLVESAHLAALMAAELGLEPARVRTTKRAAFLHDLGKALTHQAEGSPRQGGRGPGPPVRGVGGGRARDRSPPRRSTAAHHRSGAHPGRRRLLRCPARGPAGRAAQFIHRVTRIEEIAASKPGVEKVYAMQAGREVRVMVRPEQVDDIGAAVLARDVAKQIEEELTYPGQVRVTVIRELRATETAR